MGGGGAHLQNGGYGGPTALRGLFTGYYKIRFVHEPLTLAFQSISFKGTDGKECVSMCLSKLHFLMEKVYRQSS